MDWVMTVANVAVMAVTPLLLMRFTPLPAWACLVIGVPGGIVVFWLALFGAIRVVRRGGRDRDGAA